MTYYVISHYDEHQEFATAKAAEDHCRATNTSGILVKAVADFEVIQPPPVFVLKDIQ